MFISYVKFKKERRLVTIYAIKINVGMAKNFVLFKFNLAFSRLNYV